MTVHDLSDAPALLLPPPLAATARKQTGPDTGAPTRTPVAPPESVAAAGHVRVEPAARSTDVETSVVLPEPAHLRAKFGLALFLTSEALLVTGLVWTYLVCRRGWPEAFADVRLLADAGWGAISALVLLLGSGTALLAARCACWRQGRLLMLFLTLTITCGIMFVGVKVIEFGQGIYELKLRDARGAVAQMRAAPAALPADVATAGDAVQSAGPDLALGRKVYLTTCASCHGPAGEGVPQLGLPLNDSPLVRDSTPRELAEFIRKGRTPGEAGSRMSGTMPPLGGNPFLGEQELSAVAAFSQSLAGKEGASGEVPVAAASAESSIDADTLVPRWVVPVPPAGPSGLSGRFEDQSRIAAVLSVPRSDDPGAFGFLAGLYFLSVGIIALHVLAGIVIAAWLLVRAAPTSLARQEIVAARLGSAYWSAAALFWLMLFPLLYL